VLSIVQESREKKKSIKKRDILEIKSNVSNFNDTISRQESQISVLQSHLKESAGGQLCIERKTISKMKEKTRRAANACKYVLFFLILCLLHGVRSDMYSAILQPSKLDGPPLDELHIMSHNSNDEGST
jgi:hypothetical protein